MKRLIVVLMLILPLLSGFIQDLSAGDPYQESFIVIAPDNWTFQYEGTQEQFIPFGTNFFDPRRVFHPPGKPRTAPFAVITKFDYASTDSLLTLMENIGVNIIRLFISVRPLFPEYKKANEENFKIIDKYIELAEKHHMRIIMGVYDRWERWPDWMHGDIYADDYIIEGQQFIMEYWAKRYKDEPTIFSYSLENEPTVSTGWSSACREKFTAWVKEKYRNEATLKKYWIDYPFAGENWDAIKIPPDYSNPFNRRLYDFQIFREQLAADWLKKIYESLRKYDSKHMMTVGLVQMSAPLYRLAHRQGLGMFGYPAFNPHVIAPYVDYMTIHGYDWWDDNVEYFIEGLLRYSFVGKPIILEEFRFLKKTIDHTIGSVSGWLNWSAFWIGSIRWLYDLREGRYTSGGIDFKEKAGQVHSFRMNRVPPVDYFVIDKFRLLTDMTYAEEIYFNYLAKRFKADGPIGFRFINEDLKVEYEQ